MAKKKNDKRRSITIVQPRAQSGTRQFLRDWFAAQSDETKLAALLLSEMREVDSKVQDLGDDIYGEYQKDLLSRMDKGLSPEIQNTLLAGVLMGVELGNGMGG